MARVKSGMGSLDIVWLNIIVLRCYVWHKNHRSQLCENWVRGFSNILEHIWLCSELFVGGELVQGHVYVSLRG